MAFLQHVEYFLASYLQAHFEPQPKLVQALTMRDGTVAARTILCIGDEASLLETRRLVLASAAYHVFSLSSRDKIAEVLAPSIDLVVICHSVDGDQTCRIVSYLRAAHPRLPVLRLTLDGDDAPGPCDDVLVSLRGPYSLLQKVQQMLDGRKRPD